MLVGCRLKEIADSLKALEEVYSPYKFSITDIPEEEFENGLPPINTNWLNDDGKASPPCYLEVSSRLQEKDITISSVGVFFKDDGLESRKIIWGMTAGHAIMKKAEQVGIRLVESREKYQENLRIVSKEVIARNNHDNQLKIVPRGFSTPVLVRDTPLSAYCDHFSLSAFQSDGPTPLDFSERSTLDIAALAVDADCMDRDILFGLAHSSLGIHRSQVPANRPNSLNEKTRIAGYININSRDDITRLVNNKVRLIIGHTRGSLQRFIPKSPGRGGEMMTQELTFRLEDT